MRTEVKFKDVKLGQEFWWKGNKYHKTAPRWINPRYGLCNVKGPSMHKTDMGYRHFDDNETVAFVVD